MAGCWLLRGGGERERSEIGVPGERGGVEEGVLGILHSKQLFQLSCFKYGPLERTKQTSVG